MSIETEKEKETIETHNLNIWAFNINSWRKKINIINNILEQNNVDILFLTETKISPFHEKDITVLEGYSIIFNSNINTYRHGTAFIYKTKLKLQVLEKHLPYIPQTRICRADLKNYKIIKATQTYTLEKDIKTAHKEEGRIISVICEVNEKKIVLVGTYVPNSGSDYKNPFKRLAYRTLYWDIDIYNYLKNLEKIYTNIIWLGDLNVARLDNDMYKKNLNMPSCSAEERTNFQNFLNNSKWSDTFHDLNPTLWNIEDRCTFGVDIKCKLRIDYILVSLNLKAYVKRAQVEQSVKGSDHCPVSCLLSFT